MTRTDYQVYLYKANDINEKVSEKTNTFHAIPEVIITSKKKQNNENSN